MRLKSIFKLHQLQQSLGFVLALLLCLKIPFVLRLWGKGFSEVADWLRVQESLKWALARGLQSLGCFAGKRNLAHELNGKKIKK